MTTNEWLVLLIVCAILCFVAGFLKGVLMMSERNKQIDNQIKKFLDR